MRHHPSKSDSQDTGAPQRQHAAHETAHGADVLLFNAGRTRFCLPLSSIERAILLPSLQVIPGSPHYITGFLSLHDANVPVIDLARRLDLPAETTYGIDTPIILCRDAGRVAGLIVDNIVGVSKTPGALPGRRRSGTRTGMACTRMVSLNDGPCLLLDLGYLFDDDVFLALSDDASTVSSRRAERDGMR